MTLPDAPDLDGRQNTKMAADRIVLQAFGRFIEILELTGVAPAHRHTGTLTVNSTSDSPDP